MPPNGISVLEHAPVRGVTMDARYSCCATEPGQVKVMDLTAFSMCMEQKIPIVVFNAKVAGHIAEVVRGKAIGTRVE